jgi:hypothetical protein
MENTNDVAKPPGEELRFLLVKSTLIAELPTFYG